MSRWGKVLLVSLPSALLLTAALRFIHHTDREYSQWIDLFGQSAQRLEARCAELKIAGVCAAARKQQAFVGELQSYREKVVMWWWPTLVAMLLAWIAALVSLFRLARRILLRRSTQVDKATPAKSKDY